MALRSPYLEAIQAVPGDTPKEKFGWISNLVKERITICKSIEEVLEFEKLPRLLVPLVQVEAARMLNKKDKLDQSNYEAIAEALKSEDSVIVHKALRTTSFFDGTNKNITNVRYFFDYLFPEVSVNTRTKIVKKLARHLALREPSLAEEFFETVAQTYGIQKALPLLPACSESFIYDTIVKRKIRIDAKMAELLFRKSQDLAIRWIKLWDPNVDPDRTNFEYVTRCNRDRILKRLVKNQLRAFVEICESLKTVDPPTITMNKRAANAFLKNGKEYFLKEPVLFFRMLPRELLSPADIEYVFPKLFPDIERFSIGEMLQYLDHYPKEKRAVLLLKTYREVYDKNLLDDPANVIPELVVMLPAEERIKQARIKMAKETGPISVRTFKNCWTCYLPVEESIPILKNEIARTSDVSNRGTLMSCILYSCKVNGNDVALLEALRYMNDRHRNEQYWFLKIVFEALTRIYDLPRLCDDHWTVLFDILQRCYVKKDLQSAGYAGMQILEAAAEYKIIHNLPLDPVIDMIVALKATRFSGEWNILKHNPEYERRCLDACLKVAQHKYRSDEVPWKNDRVGILCDLVKSIHEFNRTRAKRDESIRPMSIKDYPWLLKEIETTLAENRQENVYAIGMLKEQLRDREKYLYALWISSKEPTVDINSGEAFALLMKHPERILENWREYLKLCKEDWSRRSVKRFVHAIRWHKDIPIKFAEQCFEDVTTKKDGTALCILALLLHGDTFARFVEPYVPVEKTIDVHHEQARLVYEFAKYIPGSARLSDPPVPLELIGKMCEGDYLSMVIGALINLCRRSALSRAIAFVKTLVTKRVSVRKHAVRLLDIISPRDQFSEFLLAQWKSEEHHSIRQVIFEKGRNLFFADPSLLTWQTFSEMTSSFTDKDQAMVGNLINAISMTRVDYTVDYLKLVLRTIDRYEETGVASPIVANWTICFLVQINPTVCKSLSEDLAETILHRFLFHPNKDISESARRLVVEGYLSPTSKKLQSRIVVFSKVFRESVKKGWNVPHPENSYFYPVNYAVRRLIREIILTLEYSISGVQLVNDISKTFAASLTPTMDPVSYLLWTYAKERTKVEMPKEFGVKLGEKLPELVEVFTPLFVPFMADTLQDLLTHGSIFKLHECYDSQLAVMEGLTEIGSTIATLMAVKLLNPIKMKKYAGRYNEVVKKLEKHEHPAVKGIFSEIVNTTSFS